MAVIYLVRHAQASFGAADYDKLSELGERQADIAGAHFAATGIAFDAVYSGGLKRQQHTCRIAMAHQTVEPPHYIDTRFDEVANEEQIKHILPLLLTGNGDLARRVNKEQPSSKDYQKIIEAVFTYWVSPACQVSQIKSWRSYAQDIAAALADVRATSGSGKTIGIFTSGGTIASIMAHVLGLSHDQIYRFYEPVINCSISQLFYSSSRLSMSSFNDHAYLAAKSAELGEGLVTYR